MDVQLNEIVKKIRRLLTQYRYDHIDSIVSTHVNAIEIAVCLVEYAIQDKRPINENERWWFEASYYVDYVLSGSGWEELSDLYSSLVTEVKSKNYLK